MKKILFLLVSIFAGSAWAMEDQQMQDSGSRIVKKTNDYHVAAIPEKNGTKFYLKAENGAILSHLRCVTRVTKDGKKRKRYLDKIVTNVVNSKRGHTTLLVETALRDQMQRERIVDTNIVCLSSATNADKDELDAHLDKQGFTTMSREESLADDLENVGLEDEE